MVKIVVLQRGWVAVGEWSQSGTVCRLEGGAVIRRWGTTKGLGELAAGPTAKTVFDPIPPLQYHELNEVFSLEVDGEKWQKALSR